MRVLGVDPGLGRCGYAVVDGPAARPAAVSFGTIQTSGPAVAPRLAELAEGLRRLLGEHRPAVVAVERLFFNANVRTAMSVGQASGVVLLLAAEAGLEVTGWTPPQVKLAVTGYGAAPKEQVAYMVTRLLGLPSAPVPADTADALAVALCHLQHAGLTGWSGRGAGRPGSGVPAGAGAGTDRSA